MPKRATSKLIHHHDVIGSAYAGAPTSTPVRYAGRLPAARSSGAAGCGRLRTARLTGIRFAIPVERARGASRAAAGGCVGRNRPGRGAVHGREGGRRAVVCDGSGADPPSPTPTEPVSASPRRLPLTSKRACSAMLRWRSMTIRGTGQLQLSLFTGVISAQGDLRAKSLVKRQWDGYALIAATLFELPEAGGVVSTGVVV